jgi:DNA-binding response OmpR family regulator
MTPISPAPILLVDQDGAARGELRAALDVLEFAVLEADDGFSALRLVEGHNVAPCLMVLDMDAATRSSSPMSCWEFLTIVNYVTKATIPVVIVSERAPHWETLARGVIAAYVAKPYERATLAEIVSAHARAHCRKQSRRSTKRARFG